MSLAHDLTLHLIGRLYGEAARDDVARLIEYQRAFAANRAAPMRGRWIDLGKGRDAGIAEAAKSRPPHASPRPPARALSARVAS